MIDDGQPGEFRVIEGAQVGDLTERRERLVEDAIRHATADELIYLLFANCSADVLREICADMLYHGAGPALADMARKFGYRLVRA